MRQRLLRALHVGLDQQGQRLLAAAALAHLRHHVLELGRLLLGELHVAVLALAEQRDLARLALVGERDHLFARARHVRQALDLDRDRRPGALHRLAVLVQHRAHAAVDGAGDDDVAPVQRPGLHQQRRDRPAALVEARLDDHALGGRLDLRLQFQHFGLQQDLLEQRVDALARLGRDRHHRRLAAEVFRHHAVREQVLAHLLRIRLVLVDLVDRHHQRHVGGLGVRDRLDGLRHGAVVGRHHQHHDVRDLGAARAHRGERLVAGRVEEGDHAARRLARDRRRCAA